MLSTPLINCSMGVATDFSRVTASAPTYVACRRISGGAMFGNIAIGSCTIAITPRITMMIAITMATIGRLIKNLAIGMKAWAGRGSESDQASVNIIRFFLLFLPAGLGTAWDRRSYRL